MDISIIIDKSAFQSLNFDELYRLSCYYKHIITPILTIEIIGDLKKETKEGNTPSEERVKDFANKLFPLETIVNVHYKKLVCGDLLGNLVSMDGRPVVGIDKAVESASGQRGFIIEETQEEKSINKWKNGDFTEADRLFSKIWRTTTTEESLLKRLKDSIKTTLPNKARDFIELNETVNKYLSSPDLQQNFIHTLLQNYEVDSWTSLNVLNRWFKADKPLLENFAPYAFHCLKVDTLFLFGLSSNLINTRPTNRVDLEYLYYQPFGNIFTSNDRVHKNLVPLLLRPYQKFILGIELKMDLKLITEYLDNLDIDRKKEFKNKPPIISNSLTFQLWKEFFGYPQRSNYKTDLSEAEIEMLKKKASELESAGGKENIPDLLPEDAEFIVKHHYLTRNDLCFCGSGKKVTDCHIPEKQFNELALKEMQRQYEQGINNK